MTVSRRRMVQSLGASALLAGFGRAAQAQVIETAKVVVGFPAGGTADVLCRRLAEKLAPGYAKAAMVENKTGAAAQIAITSMKGVTADGSVMLLTPMSMLGIYPHIYKKLPYDPMADVVPVSMLASIDFGLGVGPSVPASVKTVPEYLAWAKANPAQANFASPAAGSTPYFIGALMGRAAGFTLTHVPYRGSQPAIADMIGGQIPAVSAPVGEFLQHLASGRVRLLGTSGAARSRFAPTVPTYTEQGLKDMVFREWFGMYLPAGASPETVKRLNAALVAALASPDTIEGLGRMGMESTASTPAELAAALKSDNERWGPLVKAIGFSADA